MFLQRLGRCLRIIRVATARAVFETSAQPRVDHLRSDTGYGQIGKDECLQGKKALDSMPKSFYIAAPQANAGCREPAHAIPRASQPSPNGQHAGPRRGAFGLEQDSYHPSNQ